MIFGFNTDVKFGNTVYHVQSEARKHERLLQSQIFVKGRCIGKRATSYAEKGDQAGFSEEHLHELLKEQHKHLVEAVRAGRIEEELDAEPGEATPAAAAAAALAPAAAPPAAPAVAAAPIAAAPAMTAPVDELLAELRAASAPAAPEPLDDLAAQFAAAVADKPADPGLTLAPLSGVIGKGMTLECLPPTCAPDNSAVLICVQVMEDGGAPASGSQVTCRISSSRGPATYAYATTGGSGIADLSIALAGLNLVETNLLVQASYRSKSASRRYALRRSS